VGQHEGGEPRDARTAEHRQNDTLAAIGAPRPTAAGVDEQRLSVGPAHEDRVALADVEHEHVEPTVVEPSRRGAAERDDRQRRRQETGARRPSPWPHEQGHRAGGKREGRRGGGMDHGARHRRQGANREA
jgi:hypothetical protein